jgi:FtsX-like permease family
MSPGLEASESSFTRRHAGLGERTREIGLHLSVGAREVDLLLQFLVEAIVMSVAGGALGIAVGFTAGVRRRSRDAVVGDGHARRCCFWRLRLQSQSGCSLACIRRARRPISTRSMRSDMGDALGFRWIDPCGCDQEAPDRRS